MIKKTVSHNSSQKHRATKSRHFTDCPECAYSLVHPQWPWIGNRYAWSKQCQVLTLQIQLTITRLIARKSYLIYSHWQCITKMLLALRYG